MSSLTRGLVAFLILAGFMCLVLAVEHAYATAWTPHMCGTQWPGDASTCWPEVGP